MTYSTPATFVAGNVLTAAQMNVLGGDIIALANPPKCRVYNSAAQALSASTENVLLFDSERQDTDTMHSQVTNTGRITFTTAGFYLVWGGLEWSDSASGGYRDLKIRRGGSTVIADDRRAGGSSIGANCRQLVATGAQFAAGDYVELIANPSVGPLNTVVGSEFTPEFAAVWVSQ